MWWIVVMIVAVVWWWRFAMRPSDTMTATYGCRWQERKPESRPRIVLYQCLGWAVFLFCLVSPLFYEYPGLTTPVTFDGDKMVEHPYGCLQPLGRVVTAIPVYLDRTSLQTFVETKSGINEVTFRVSLRVINPEKFFRKTDRRVDWSIGTTSVHLIVEEFLSRLDLGLYRLWKAKQPVLAKIIEDEKGGSKRSTTQEVFRSLVQQDLNPLFAEDGVEIDEANLRIEDFPARH